MVDDPNERKERPLGSPSRLLIAEPLEIAKDCTPQIAKPAQQQLSLAGGPSWKPQLFISWLLLV